MIDKSSFDINVMITCSEENAISVNLGQSGLEISQRKHLGALLFFYQFLFLFLRSSIQQSGVIAEERGLLLVLNCGLKLKALLINYCKEKERRNNKRNISTPILTMKHILFKLIKVDFICISFFFQVLEEFFPFNALKTSVSTGSAKMQPTSYKTSETCRS